MSNRCVIPGYDKLGKESSTNIGKKGARRFFSFYLSRDHHSPDMGLHLFHSPLLLGSSGNGTITRKHILMMIT